MLPTPIAYEEWYTIRTYDVDRFKRMTAPSLLRVLNEAAMQNVLILKLSVWDLEPEQLSWVLLRVDLQINRLPSVSEKVRIVTYPSGFERAFTYRDFRVYDESGQLLAQATTTWVLMHLETRRPMRMPTWITERAQPLPAEEDRLERAATLPKPTGDFPLQHPITVGWHDLDWNRHLNNVHYLRIMLDTLSEEVFLDNQLERIRLQYKAEANLGDELQGQARWQDNNGEHLLLRGETLLASAQTTWKKNAS